MAETTDQPELPTRTKPAKKPAVRYSAELAAAICVRLGGGESLAGVCSGDDMPTEATVRQWTDDVPEFATMYTRARQRGYAKLADELLDITDDGRNDWMLRNDPKNPGYQANGENVQRSRLRFDARRWILSKMLPKIYGDKLELGLGLDGDLVARIFGSRRSEANGSDLV